MRLSKILYSLPQRLVQNQAKLSEKTLVAKMSGIWQQSTQKTALTVKKCGRERVKYFIIQQIVTMPIYGKEALNICHPT